ncbi:MULTISPECIES: hypothetical protein [unclassified Rubrivivax]|uniref:hypothetical protein n=1 Tax=unclassified Rubrivivax TaxID=2649762 RepID=UPI0013E969B9|nr:MULTISPECIES: hypothetical protein [unclassified Rubrivivax]MCC9598642.1 hypothetical protein [Rubrivivax sp. JA1055]MCC9648343.1 hypothetical protein [Rubrivivax sp. JA1029]MCD0418650.1 hypothetical protein [Rubrivivax sp. JA1024]
MRAALALALLALAGAADAQRIWRCGPDGRLLQDRPCRDGEAMTVRDERPSASDEAAARDVARREMALAEQLRDERRAREREAVTAAAGFVEPEKPAVQSVLKKTPKKAPRKKKNRRD